MAKIPDDQTYPAGKIIIRSGEQADRAFLIKQGKVLVYKPIRDGKFEIAEIHKGEIFGEMALVDRRYHKYTIEALEDTVVTPIERNVIVKKLDEADPLVKTILHSALSRLSKTTQKRLQENNV